MRLIEQSSIFTEVDKKFDNSSSKKSPPKTSKWDVKKGDQTKLKSFYRLFNFLIKCFLFIKKIVEIEALTKLTWKTFLKVKAISYDGGANITRTQSIFDGYLRGNRGLANSFNPDIPPERNSRQISGMEMGDDFDASAVSAFIEPWRPERSRVSLELIQNKLKIHTFDVFNNQA